MKNFRPVQEKVFNWAKDKQSVALFMEMRLGKTLVAIRWCQQWLDHDDKVLIIGKKAFLENWRNELLDEGYLRQQIVILGGSFDYKIDTLEKSNAVFFITNYEAIVSCPNIIVHNWKVIIVDESTQIKNPNAKITKYLSGKLTEHVNYRAILSGLPNPESVFDYFSQFKFLFGHFMGYDNFWQWRYRYFYQDSMYSWAPKVGTKQLIQQELSSKSFTVTRKEAGIGEEKVYKRIYVDMTTIQERIYKDIEEEFRYEYRQEKKDTKWILVRLEWLTRISGGFTAEGQNLSDNKLNEIIELMNGELNKEKVVIYFKYNHEIDYVFRSIKRAGFSCGKFTGEEKIGFTFDNKISKGIRVVCVQQKCARYGLDWSSSSTAIYYSNWYEHEVRAQTEDRIVSVDKKEPLLYFDLLARNSMDDHILDALKDKKIQSSSLKLNQIISKVLRKEK